MKASVEHAGDGIFVGISPSGIAHLLDAGGGQKRAPSPVEMLLTALGACTGSDVVSILAKQRQTVTRYRAEITAERREEFPRSLQTVHVHHVIHGRQVSADAVARAVHLSDEKYCSVAATLRPTAQITSTFEIVEE